MSSTTMSNGGATTPKQQHTRHATARSDELPEYFTMDPAISEEYSSASATFANNSGHSSSNNNNNGQHASNNHNNPLVRLDFGTDGGAVPFCGRRSELQELAAVYDKVIRTKRAASVWLQGNPGSGKSRFLQAFETEIRKKAALRAAQWQQQQRNSSRRLLLARADSSQQPMAGGGGGSSKHLAAQSTQRRRKSSTYDDDETEVSGTDVLRNDLKRAEENFASGGGETSENHEDDDDTVPEMQQLQELYDQKQNVSAALPPIFCSAKFEEGETAQALGPILECFATLTQALLSNDTFGDDKKKTLREHWVPLLSEALKKDVTVLATLIPELDQLDLPPPPPMPPPATLDRALTTASGASAASSTAVPQPRPKKNFLMRAITIGSQARPSPAVAQSQPAPSLTKLPAAAAKQAVAQSQPVGSLSGRRGSFLSRLTSMGQRSIPKEIQQEASPAPLTTDRTLPLDSSTDPSLPTSRPVPQQELSQLSSTNHWSNLPTPPPSHVFSLTSDDGSSEVLQPTPPPPLPAAPPRPGTLSPKQLSENSVVTSAGGDMARDETDLSLMATPSPQRLAMTAPTLAMIASSGTLPPPPPPPFAEGDSAPEAAPPPPPPALRVSVSDGNATEPAPMPTVPLARSKTAGAQPSKQGPKLLAPARKPPPISTRSHTSDSIRSSRSNTRPPAFQLSRMQDMSMRTTLLNATQKNSRNRKQNSKNNKRNDSAGRGGKIPPTKSKSDAWKDYVASHSMDDAMIMASEQLKPSNSFGTLEQEDYSVERVHFALREYLRCVCKERTVVFCLDDVQWAGREAVTLLRALIMDASPVSRKFLFLGSHRPLPHGHEVRKIMDDFDSSTAASPSATQTSILAHRPHRILMESVQEADVADLLAQLLKREEEDVRPLATLIHRKTDGNIFFAIEFLRLLEQKGLVHYSILKTRWEWVDLNEITARTVISDNVVDVVAAKICGAPQDVKLALLTAAAFGVARFDAETLFRAIPGGEDMKETLVRNASTEIQLQSILNTIPSVESLICTLEEAVDEGYLESLGASTYKFAHNRIREAAMSLLPGGIDMNMLHLRIGRQLHRWLEEQIREGWADERLLVQVVIQLNQAAHLIRDEQEKKHLSELNYAAAENAIQHSSFFPASDFLRIGIDLLGEHAWENHYENMIKLSDALMRMDYCCGRLVVSVELADEILSHARGFNDKKMAYHIKVLWLTQNEKVDEALELILSVLDELGAPVPRRFLGFYRVLEWFRTQRMIRGMSDQELLSLPPATAEHIDDIGSFMERLEEVAMNGSNPRPNLLSVALLRVMQLTLKHGRFSMTPTCLVSWGWFNARSGKLDAAHRFGKLGVKLAKEESGGYHDARAILMYYMHIYHWRTPYHDGIKPTTEALQKLWDLGAIEYVFLDTITYLRIYFCCGLRLQPLAEDIRKYVDLLRDYGHRLAFGNHAAFFRCVAALMGQSRRDSSGHLSGAISLVDSIADWEDQSTDSFESQQFFERMMVAYIFDDLGHALEMSSNLFSPFEEGPDVFLPFRVFFMGMVALSSYHLQRRKATYRRQGKKMISIMEKWDKDGVVNVHHMLYLMKAELNAGNVKEFSKVRRSYDDAITKAGRRGFLHFQALGNERAGIYCRSKGEHDWARLYIVQARSLYSDWGAMAKVKKLTEEYPDYLVGSKVENQRGSTIHSRTRLGEISREFYKNLRTDSSDAQRGSLSSEFHSTTQVRTSLSTEFRPGQ